MPRCCGTPSTERRLESLLGQLRSGGGSAQVPGQSAIDGADCRLSDPRDARSDPDRLLRRNLRHRPGLRANRRNDVGGHVRLVVDGGLFVSVLAVIAGPDYAPSSHVAPLGLVLYTGTSLPAHYRGGAFVGAHGSWDRGILNGCKVAFVPFANGRPSATQRLPSVASRRNSAGGFPRIELHPYS